MSNASNQYCCSIFQLAWHSLRRWIHRFCTSNVCVSMIRIFIRGLQICNKSNLKWVIKRNDADAIENTHFTCRNGISTEFMVFAFALHYNNWTYFMCTFIYILFLFFSFFVLFLCSFTSFRRSNIALFKCFFMEMFIMSDSIVRFFIWISIVNFRMDFPVWVVDRK